MTGDDDNPDEHLDGSFPESRVQDNASPRTNRDKERELAVRESEREQFWKAVFHSDVGRREMWGILHDAHFDEDRFGVSPSGAPDPLASWLNRGEQAFGYRLFLTFMRYARPGVLQMLDEHDHRLAKPEPSRRRSKS